MATFTEDEIPVISLAGIDDDAHMAAVKKKIVEACEVWGIFQVVDHGVDPKLIDDMIRLTTEFYYLPPEEKLRFDMSGGKKGGFMISTRRKGDVEDWREVVTFFTYPSRDRRYSEWPDKPEGWIKTTEEFSEKLMDLASKILEVLSEAMDLEKGALKEACGELNQKILTNFYPKCSNSDLELGLPRHTDPGTITILLQDQVGGLQATKDGANSWINIPPMKGAFVINIGDHGHYLSNGRFKSADHRALANAKSDRLSIATFQYPTPEAIVYPLKVGEGEKAVIENPISFAEMYKKKMSNEPVLAMFNHKGHNKINPST
ncbi:hypothetical protein IC575_027332 [Cucumis melo]|uniref:Naringenin,2-oxoglutarate 3-dioxygenase-like n=1 Tax=Cucumis melo TaxID=3656 RepID=A0A1S3CC29_CUCME|nr:naringenin,2-oxoglutarate 3-dioxygenase-like [Cucumis melo]